MRIEIEWESEFLGVARVIEPCCDALRPAEGDCYRDPFFQFNVWKKNGILEVGFHVDWEDVNPLPLRFCPSCGHTVHVVSERHLPRRAPGWITSGKIDMGEIACGGE